MGGKVTWEEPSAEEQIKEALVCHWLAPLVWADSVPAALRQIEAEKKAQQAEEPAEPEDDGGA